ncbi:MAG: hypothetical protein GY861_03545, partial [bacterium]|nr:hypothetical protein [bacterium]
MINDLAQIIAQVYDPNKIGKLQGEGVVEKKLDNSTYLLRFSSGKIKVTVTSGTLTPDTTVQVKKQGDKVILQPVSPQRNTQDQIAFSETKQGNRVNRATHELLSIITNNTSIQKESSEKQDYANIVKKLSAALQNNPKLLQLSNEMHEIAKKIIPSSSQISQAPDQQTLSSMKALVLSTEQKLIELCCKQQNSIKLTIPVQQGFSYFASGKEAIDWLTLTQPEIDKSTLDKLAISKSEPVIIQTVTTGKGESVAIVMNKDEGAVLLDAFIHNDAKNPLWEAVPTDLLLSVMESKGSISKDTIESIDRILQFYNSASQTQQVPSANDKKDVVQQWIAQMFDSNTAQKALSSFTPVNTAGDIALDLEQNVEKTLPKTDPLSDIIKNVLTTTIKKPDLPKAEIISNAIDKMGYNFEKELAKAATSESVDKKELTNSVKAQLLSLLLQTLPDAKSASPAPSVQSGAVQDSVSQPTELSAIDKLTQALVTLAGDDLDKVVTEHEKTSTQQTEKPVQETAQELKKLIGELIQQLTEASQKVAESININQLNLPIPEANTTTPLALSLNASFQKSDSIDQLLSYFMQSADNIEKSIETIKTAISDNQPTSTNSTQQVVNASEKHIAVIKEFLTQLQDFIKSNPQVTTDAIPSKDQNINTTPPPPAIPEEGLQKLLESLRNIVLASEGKPETLPPEVPDKSSPTVSTEQLQNQTKSTLQMFISALEQNNNDIVKQLQELSSSVKPEVQVEIDKLISQLSEMLKNVSDTVKSDIINTLLSQESFSNKELSTIISNALPEDITSVSKADIEKLLTAILEIINKQKPEIDNISALLKSLASLESKPLAGAFTDKISDTIKSIIGQLESLLQSTKEQQTPAANLLNEQNSIIKEITGNTIKNFFKPFDNVLSTLLNTIKPAQADQSNINQIQVLTDNLYKTIISARNTLSDDIASLTQKVIEDVEHKNNFNTATINTNISKLTNIVSSLTTNLLSTITQDTLPIENALQNILQNLSTASAQWTNDANSIQSSLEQNLSNVISELRENLSQAFDPQVTSQKDFKGQLESFLTQTLQKSISDTLAQIKQHASQVTQSFQSSEFVAIKELEQQWQSVLKTIEPVIKNLETNIQNIITNAEKKFSQSLQSFQQGEINQETASKNMQSIANRLSNDINRIFDSTIREMMTLLEKSANDSEKNPEQVQRQINSAISQMKQEIDQLIRTLNKQIDNFTSRTEKGFNPTLPEGIRQQVETALTRLESLQLLAKPTPTAEGQQQVLSLPIKFGDEWTDVNILLIKKQNKKKGKAKGNRFSVRMNVAPSQCGPIVVNMDY